MELSHSFTVPADVETTWATFMDLQEVGGCFPGATVTEASAEGFAGTVKVKLGPIALVYAGTGAFVERDDSAHRAVIEAKGKDKRGNGTAGATVTIQLSDTGDGSTRADVQTDLAVTGKPAQFGRGVMQDVSDKLLGQFVGCIEGKLSPAQAAAPAATAGAAPDAATAAPVAPDPTAPAAPAPAPEGGALDEAPAPSPQPAPPPQPAPSPQPAPPPQPSPPAPLPAPAQDDALDLGSTVLPVLIKTYGKQVAVAVVAVVVVVVIWRALSR